MSEVHGPARRLVEAMEAALFRSDDSFYRIKQAASAHDAAHAALVQAVEAYLDWLDNVSRSEDMSNRYEKVVAQLRAALKAVEGEADNGE